MKKKNEILIILSHCRGIENAGILKLLKLDPTLELINHLKAYEFLHYGIVSSKSLSQFLQDFSSFSSSIDILKFEKASISIVTILDQDYPKYLLEIPNPPAVLYCLGDKNLLNWQKSISIVGTRIPTTYGKSLTNYLVKDLTEQGWLIISGLAKGIDSQAHIAAMMNGGKTISVIGGGFEYIYPQENKILAKQIEQQQLLISEYPPNTRPQKWHFPLRNRIISGLSLGTVVIQAKEKSGSLITANYALEQGREVFAVPGSIFEDSCTGTNRLIQQGAKAVLSAKDIFEEFPYLYESISNY